jgi:hypothetical protein
MVFHPTSTRNQLIQHVFFGFKIFNVILQAASRQTSCITKNLATPIKSNIIANSNEVM